MNDLQSEAIEIALKGHNLLLLGCAGSGKSYTVQKIADLLLESGKKVQVTCSTGIACSVYDKKFHASTVHKYLGLGDGRYGPEEISKIISNSSKYDHVLRNVSDLDCLIVDECSMISARTFELIHALLKLRNEKLTFGGIQVIFVGDFFQLPPVANILYQETGKYCFESKIFIDIFVHKVVLSKCTRTSDPTLRRIVQEIFSGGISKHSEDFLMQLNRPLPETGGCDSIKLFAKNNIVDDYNRTCILNFPGQLYEYPALDSGTGSALVSVTASKTLWLKEGCPVILLQNLTDQLCNGFRGKICSLENGPLVEFENWQVRSISKVKFSVFNPSTNTDIAAREQYPLKPAFGLTIHKAQGMTLDRVEVDCTDIFMPGQLGVALSRVRHSDGLRVINYHPRYILKPAKILTDYMKHRSEDTLPDKSCCRKELCQPVVVAGSAVLDEETTNLKQSTEGSGPSNAYSLYDPVVSEADYTDDFDQHIEDEFDTVVASIIRDEERTLDFEFPEGFDINIMKESLKVEKEVTSIHTNMNNIISRLDDSVLTVFVKKLFLKLAELISTISDSDVQKGVPEKYLVKFNQLVHAYSISSEYKMNCLMLFENQDSYTFDHKVICYKVLECVKILYIQKKVDLLKNTTFKVYRRYVTDSSRARIRYVAGFCIAKLRRKYVNLQKANIYGKSKQAQESYSEAKCRVKLIGMLKEDEQFLKDNTSEPDSLVDVERRQNDTRGLTNVTDSLFKFFVDLTETSLGYLTNESLLKHGKNMYSDCYSQITYDKKLHNDFVSIVVRRLSEEKLEELPVQNYEQVDLSTCLSMVTDELVLYSTQINHICMEVIEKYLYVLFAQFRKDVKTASKMEKKMAHRKQIKVASGSKQKKSKKVSSVTTDQSDNVQPLEPQIHSTVSDPESSAVSLEPSAQILSTESELHSSDSGAEPIAETSAVSEDEDLCAVCNTDRADAWIQCDSCSNWFHRKCAGLSNAKKWKTFSREAVQWFCNQCK